VNKKEGNEERNRKGRMEESVRRQWKSSISL